jgi:hypothetical protein
LISIYIDLEASTRNIKGRQMHPVKVERRRQVSNVEIMDMWRRSTIIRDTI